MPSYIDTNRKEPVCYTSEIIDGGEQPLYRVVAQDAPDDAVECTVGWWWFSGAALQLTRSRARQSSSSAWRLIMGRIKRRDDCSVSGPEYFGFGDPTMRMLIQELPGARQCINYEWTDFDAVLAAQAARGQSGSSGAGNAGGAGGGSDASSARGSRKRSLQPQGGSPQDALAKRQRADDAARDARARSVSQRRRSGAQAGLWAAYDEMQRRAAQDELASEYAQQSAATPRDYASGGAPSQRVAMELVANTGRDALAAARPNSLLALFWQRNSRK